MTHLKHLIALSLVVSCGGLEVDDPASVESAVIGTPSNGYRGAVELLFNTGPGTTGRCSGVVLTPHWILTAGHCGTEAGIPTTGSSYRTSMLQVAYGDSAGVRRQSYPAAPNQFGRMSIYYYLGCCGPTDFDFALIRLYDQGAAPAYSDRILLDRPEDFNFIAYEAVGWGRDGAGGSGTKQVAFLTPNVAPWHLLSANTDGDDGLCRGDSGGPWYVRGGSLPLVAGLSKGLTSGDDGCSNPNSIVLASRIAPKWDWVRSTTRRKGLPITCTNHTSNGIRFARCTE